MSTWWIDEPRLVGSRNPTEDDLRQLRRDGGAIWVCLLDPREQAPNDRPEYAVRLGDRWHAIAIPDFQAPTLAQLEEFVAIAREASEQAKLVVHCQGGIGRTGTMAAAYWVAQGLSATEAIARGRRARPQAVEMPTQRDCLIAFERQLAR